MSLSNSDLNKIQEIVLTTVKQVVTEEAATKEDLKAFAKKDDLKDFATKDDLKDFPTKKDFNDLKERVEANSNELKSFKKEYLKDREDFVTKDDLKNFATKEDLKIFATKDDLDKLREEIKQSRKELLITIFEHFPAKNEVVSIEQFEKFKDEVKENFIEVKDMILGIRKELDTEHEFRFKRIQQNSSEITKNRKAIVKIEKTLNSSSFQASA